MITTFLTPFSAVATPIEGRNNLVLTPDSRNYHTGTTASQEELLLVPKGVHSLQIVWRGARAIVVWLRDGGVHNLGTIPAAPERGVSRRLLDAEVLTADAVLYFRLPGNATAGESAAASRFSIRVIPTPTAGSW